MEKMEHTHPHQQRHMGSELGLWESSVAGVVFPTLIFCWLDVFFSPPGVPSFSRWKEKNGREQQQQAATRGEKERKLGGGKKTAAIAGPWGGGEGGAFRFRSHILPLDACASSAVY